MESEVLVLNDEMDLFDQCCELTYPKVEILSKQAEGEHVTWVKIKYFSAGSLISLGSLISFKKSRKQFA